jgi:Guanosine polyphosphate pyrophosphohydrolases/synthetases
VWVRLSRCCTPVPGDEIIGFVTHGHGVSVHRVDCVNLVHLTDTQRERMVDVHWAPTEGSVFLVAIQVEALDRTRLALRRDQGAVRPAREHPVRYRDHQPGPGRLQPVHLRDG